MNWQQTVQIIPVFTAAAISAAVALYSWRHRAAPGATWLAWLMMVATGWSLANALKMMSETPEAAYFWHRVMFSSVAVYPVVLLSALFHYLGRDRWLTRRRLVGLLVLPLITVLLIWTNQFHGWFIHHYAISFNGSWFVAPEWVPGPWFWVHTTYFFSLLLFGAITALRSVITSAQPYRGQAVLILFWMVLSLGISWYVTFGQMASDLNLAPVGLTIFGLTFAWGVFRYRLLDLVPVARDVLFDSMSDGMIVLDSQNRIVDINRAARKMIGFPKSEIIGQSAELVASPCRALVERIGDTTDSETDITVVQNGTPRHYSRRISPLTDKRGRLTGRLIFLRDITERKRAEEAMGHLAVMEERQRLARDLHDSVTQALYSLILFAEAGYDSARAADLPQVRHYLSRCGETAQQALKEMRLLIYELRPQVLEQEGLVGALRRRLEAVERQAGVETQLLVESLIELPADVETDLYRIAQEALNNILKHSAATRVIVRIGADGAALQMEIVDNGKGFDLESVGERAGIGLASMRERVERLGGSLRIASKPGEGTRTQVIVPQGSVRS
jgi:PAS domain S-box-containing protein